MIGDHEKLLTTFSISISLAFSCLESNKAPRICVDAKNGLCCSGIKSSTLLSGRGVQKILLQIAYQSKCLRLDFFVRRLFQIHFPFSPTQIHVTLIEIVCKQSGLDQVKFHHFILGQNCHLLSPHGSHLNSSSRFLEALKLRDITCIGAPEAAPLSPQSLFSSFRNY